MVKYDLCYNRSDRVRFNLFIALNRHQPGGIASIEATEIVASVKKKSTTKLRRFIFLFLLNSGIHRGYGRIIFVSRLSQIGHNYWF